MSNNELDNEAQEQQTFLRSMTDKRNENNNCHHSRDLHCSTNLSHKHTWMFNPKLQLLQIITTPLTLCWSCLPPVDQFRLLHPLSQPLADPPQPNIGG